MLNILRSIRKYIYKLAHYLSKKLGLVELLSFYALGEKNSYCINPLYFTIDVDDADSIIIFEGKNAILPINTDKAAILYTSHNLEHLTDDASNKFFSEAYRCLKPGGELLIEVPDCEHLYKEYLSGNWDKINLEGHKGVSYHNNFRLSTEEKSLIKALQGEDMFHMTEMQHITLLNVLSSYRSPAYTGIGGTVVVSENKFNLAINELTMDKFFTWCLLLKSIEQQESGGHSSNWYPNRLLNVLNQRGFKASLRGYREGKTLAGIKSMVLVPDRNHRSFYSFRVSAIKPK